MFALTGIPVKTGSTSCDTLMNSVAGETSTSLAHYMKLMMMISFSAEGAHWGEDDWEACEVTIVDFPISLELNNNLLCLIVL